MKFGTQALTDWLVERFSNYYPHEFQTKLTTFQWKKIYTTNIDDVIEKIFDANQIPYVLQNTKTKKRNPKELY